MSECEREIKRTEQISFWQFKVTLSMLPVMSNHVQIIIAAGALAPTRYTVERQNRDCKVNKETNREVSRRSPSSG